MLRNVVVLLEHPEGRLLIEDACRDKGLRFAEFQELINAEIEQTGKQRKSGMWDSFDDILDRIQMDDE